MRLGDFRSLKAALWSVFGEDTYTDDNAVVLTDSIDQKTVALLYSTGKPNELRIEFCDGRPSQVIKIEGAGPDTLN